MFLYEIEKKDITYSPATAERHARFQEMKSHDVFEELHNAMISQSEEFI